MSLAEVKDTEIGESELNCANRVLLIDDELGYQAARSSLYNPQIRLEWTNNHAKAAMLLRQGKFEQNSFDAVIINENSGQIPKEEREAFLETMVAEDLAPHVTVFTNEIGDRGDNEFQGQARRVDIAICANNSFGPDYRTSLAAKLKELGDRFDIKNYPLFILFLKGSSEEIPMGLDSQEKRLVTIADAQSLDRKVLFSSPNVFERRKSPSHVSRVIRERSRQEVSNLYTFFEPTIDQVGRMVMVRSRLEMGDLDQEGLLRTFRVYPHQNGFVSGFRGNLEPNSFIKNVVHLQKEEDGAFVYETNIGASEAGKAAA